MNVGNLLPNETAVIAFTYAVMYRWAGDNLRMLIPTTIAPRYGESPLQPHQTPESSLTVENQFSLQVEVFGSLREARFECPSHEVTLTTSSDKTMIALSQCEGRDGPRLHPEREGPAGGAQLRALRRGSGRRRRAKERRRGGGGVLPAGVPGPAETARARPGRGHRLLGIDAGRLDHAGQAGAGRHPRWVAACAIASRSWRSGTPRRRCSISCGRAPTRTSAWRASSPTSWRPTWAAPKSARRLQAAYAATSGSEAADIFLVTDGEVSEWERVVKDAKKSGRRIFTVGVGHAVSEAFVRELATVTGGECELVSPREGMADRVVRHFERMRAPRAKRVVVHWPEGARNQAPASFGAVFEGDTVFASAQFDRPSVTGHVVLEIETESGQVFRQELAIGQAPAPQSGSRVSTVARLAAAARIKELDERPPRRRRSISARQSVDELAGGGRAAGRREGVRDPGDSQGAADTGGRLGRRGHRWAGAATRYGLPLALLDVRRKRGDELPMPPRSGRRSMHDDMCCGRLCQSSAISPSQFYRMGRDVEAMADDARGSVRGAPEPDWKLSWM